MIFRFLFLVLTAVATQACQGTDQTGTDKPSAPQEEPKSSLKVTEVPVFNVKVDRDATPLPYPVSGLQFQRNLKGAHRENNRYRPMGDGKFGPGGDLYFTFPKQDLVMAFRKPHYELNYYGSPSYGGKGEIIKNPGLISFSQENMVLTNRDNGQALVLNTQAEFKDAYELKIAGAITGPDGSFLVSSPRNPNAFARMDANLNPIQRYLMNDHFLEKGADPRMVFHILENWEVIAARRNGSQIYHMKANAFFIRHLNLNLGKLAAKETGHVEIYGVRYVNHQYWILAGFLIPAKPPGSRIITLDPKGKLVHYWQTPFFADGFDVQGDNLLLFNTIQGEAETYKKP